MRLHFIPCVSLFRVAQNIIHNTNRARFYIIPGKYIFFVKSNLPTLTSVKYMQEILNKTSFLLHISPYFYAYYFIFSIF